MHALFFELKTAHLSAQVIARRLAASIHLTPARFDMLVAINRVAPFPGARQDELRRTLHVSTSNVSRMVRALAKLGWVSRTRDRDDGRTWRLRLTEHAREVLAGDGAEEMKCAHRVVRRLVCEGRSVIDTMIRAETLFHFVRRLTGRSQVHIYPYGHPDE